MKPGRKKDGRVRMTVRVKPETKRAIRRERPKHGTDGKVLESKFNQETKMKPKAQQIAIAEACGKTLPDSDLSVPDYLNDLNAMHEAEKVLKTFDQQSAFEKELMDSCNCNYDREGLYDIFKLAHATAAQRAEAFLRTIGLWRDGE